MMAWAHSSLEPSHSVLMHFSAIMKRPEVIFFMFCLHGGCTKEAITDTTSISSAIG